MDSPAAIRGKGSPLSTPEPDHPVPVKKFHQGEPVALAITQIFIGIIGMAFGILIDFVDTSSSFFLLIKLPYWGGILYIISGSLTVAAARNPKIPLVKGMLAMNTLSAITAAVGIVLLSFSLSPSLPFDLGSTCNALDYDTKEKCDEAQNIGMGILVFLMVLSILEFCISISVATFGCKMLCRDPFTETVVVVYQNVTPSSAEQYPPYDCRQPAIHP